MHDTRSSPLNVTDADVKHQLNVIFPCHAQILWNSRDVGEIISVIILQLCCMPLTISLDKSGCS
jgi:hypothetical protein